MKYKILIFLSFPLIFCSCADKGFYDLISSLFFPLLKFAGSVLLFLILIALILDLLLSIISKEKRMEERKKGTTFIGKVFSSLLLISVCAGLTWLITYSYFHDKHDALQEHVNEYLSFCNSIHGTPTNGNSYQYLSGKFVLIDKVDAADKRLDFSAVSDRLVSDYSAKDGTGIRFRPERKSKS